MNPDGAPGLLASTLQAAGRAAVWLATAIGIELKPSYFDVAVKNLREIERVTHAPTLFDWQEKEAA